MIINMIDLLAGMVILIYAIWIWVKNYAPFWLWGCFMGLAALMIFTALVSWGGVCSERCPGMLTCSSVLAVPIMLWELALGVLTLTNVVVLEKYLHEHHHQLDLSNYDMKLIATRHALVADGLFVLAACEFMRVLSSKGLRSALLSEQEHYDGVRGRSGAAPAGRGKPPPGWGGVVNRDDDDDDDDDEEVGGAETSGLKGLRGPTAASYSTVVPGGASATGW